VGKPKEKYTIYKKTTPETNNDVGQIHAEIWKKLLLSLSNEYVVSFEDVFYELSDKRVCFGKRKGDNLFSFLLNSAMKKKKEINYNVFYCIIFY
jgi:hypothetical protein